MKADTSYLRRINRAWYFRIKVPAAVRDCYNRREILEVALHTRDLDQANIRKLPILAKYKREFDALRQIDPSAREAATIRKQLAELRAGDDLDHASAIEAVAEDRAAELHSKGMPLEHAKRWLSLATASTLSIEEASKQWLDASRLKEGTKRHHQHALGELREFMCGDALPSAVTPELAVRYVNERLRGTMSGAYNTRRNKLNSLYGLWEWMGENLVIPRGLNPWRGFKLRRENAHTSEGEKRGYTDDELVALFGERPTYQGLADVMVLGLYTGARLNELCSLRARDVRKQRGMHLVHIAKSKTKAGVRDVAVTHAVARAVLDSRLAVQASPEAQLFPEFTPGGYDGKLSWSVGKAFGRWRDDRGLTRQTDFHSFRRTVITVLENKRVPAGLTASFVGHEGGTLQHDVYSDGPWVKTLREIAAKIVYRKPVEHVVAAFTEVRR